ncbi:MAG: beta-N-acetylhexosaminidase [Myxococcota bacterium]|nr:beta-N-acetylhexosaminidase [Myxococcota bacterium]
MSTDPLAGLVLAGFDGTRADDDGVRALVDLGVGGFILFGRNIESPRQVHALLAGIREACGDRPVLFAVDQEGGRVARLREPLTVWPPMARLGEAGDRDLAERLGLALASEIRALGFNLVFAPVLDVRGEGTTDAIGDRSLGGNPELVSSLGTALIEGIQTAGLIACGKHFPGHGPVAVDSHLDLPVCQLEQETLMEDHVLPFARAAGAGVGAIMSAHVRYPSVDPQNPATFSTIWLTEILRKKLAFDGLILTDDLEMGAVTSSGSVGAAAVRALAAGADGVLVCHGLEQVRETIAQLRSAADKDVDFLAACVTGLARLQKAAGTHPPQALPLEDLEHHLGRTAHQEVAAQLQEGPKTVGLDPTEASSSA